MKRMFIKYVFALCLSPVAAAGQFTDWSTPVNLGASVNSVFLDSCVSISKSGLSLFFSSNRQTGNPTSTDRDLYVSKRDNIEDAWGEPQSLMMLNSSVFDSCPALSLDEHRLYFTSSRPGCGAGPDLWVSRRHDRRDDFGWEPPINLGCALNSALAEVTPAFFEDEAGRVVMYFSSNRTGQWDIYQSVMMDDDTFGPATPVVELNGPYMEQGVTVRRDGLEVIFGSNRLGGSGIAGSMDFWVATRASTEDAWSVPVYVSSLGNPAWMGGRIALSFDGREFYFGSFRAGGLGSSDLWVATREKVRGKK